MSETNFRVGDTVQLRSGGPGMTVVELPTGEPERIGCTWFEKGAKHSGYFPPKALARVEPEDQASPRV